MTSSRRALEAQLRTTLRVKADQLAPEIPLATVETTPRRGGRTPRQLLVIAAAVAVVVGVVAVAVFSRGSSPSRPATSTTVAPPALTMETSVTGPALLPARAPAGMELWSLSTVHNVAASQNPNVVTQLFGRVDAAGAPDPGLLVEMQPTSAGASVFPGATERVTVRGQQAAVVGSKDGGAAGSELNWIENDAVWVRVTLRGISPAAAAAFLDALQPRDGVLTNGFDPASATNGLGLLGEHIATAGGAASVEAYAEYGSTAPSVGTRGGIFVHTTTEYGYPGRLRTWIAGSGDQRESQQYDPDIGLIVSRADGTQITVGPPTVDRAELARVAASVTTQSQATMRSLADEVDHRLAALPTIASTDQGAVTFELHGDGDPAAVCARTRTGPAVCAPPFGQFGTVDFDQPASGLGSARLGGDWFVFAGAPSPATFSVRSDPRNPETPVPDQHTNPLGPWQVTSAVVTLAVDSVQVSTDGSSFVALKRPG